MKIETYPLGDLQANCYLVYSDGEAVVIDPGDDGVFIAEKIYEKELSLKAILVTHGHFDHVLGAGELQMILPARHASQGDAGGLAPFYIHKADEFLLKKANDSAKFWLKREFRNPLPQKIKFFKEGDEISFGNYFLEITEMPGHTPGSVCFELKDKNSKNKKGSTCDSILFTGDTLFQSAVGRTDFAYSSKDDLQTSLKKIFKKFPKNTLIYSGHGEATSIADEIL